MPQFVEHFGEMTEIMRGLVVAVILIPSAVTGLLAGSLSDKISRKKTISLGCLIFALGMALGTYHALHLAPISNAQLTRRVISLCSGLLNQPLHGHRFPSNSRSRRRSLPFSINRLSSPNLSQAHSREVDCRVSDLQFRSSCARVLCLFCYF